MATAVISEETAGKAAAAPEDKVPFKAKFSYAMGGTTDIFGHWLYNGLANPVYNVFLGLSPTQVSMGLLAARLTDAFTDPLFGWLSDNTRSKWGRRRPWVLFGSIIAGIGLPCLFLAQPGWSKDAIFWFMIISTVIYAPLISAYNMPYQSLGSELTPSYHERTSIMGWKAVTQKTAGMLLGGALWFAYLPIFKDASGKSNVALGAAGAAAIAGLIMIVSGILNFSFVRERYYKNAQTQEKVGFIAMFRDTFSCKPYVVLLGTALVYAVPTGMMGVLGFYVTTYHVFAGNMEAASGIMFWAGASYAVCGVAGVPVASWLSRRLGKPRALVYTLAAGIVAFGSTWWLYTPTSPWLSVVSNGFNGFSATGLWVILPSMCVDVVDYDELHSGKRREGAYSSTFSWVLKVGMSLSMFLSGPLLEFTKFDAKLLGNQLPGTMESMRLLFAVIPVVALLLALVVVHFFPLTPKRMGEIRAELEARRGTV